MLEIKMNKQIIYGIISVILLFTVVYTIDSLYLRGLFWERLIVNIIIVALFYFAYIKFVYKK